MKLFKMKLSKPIWIFSFFLVKAGVKRVAIWVRIADMLYKIYKHLLKPLIMDTGIITNEEGKVFGKYLDPFIKVDDVKLLGFSAENFDDDAIAWVINYADNKWGDKLPSYCVPALRSIIVEVPQKNYSNLAENIAKVSEGLVKLKNDKLKSFIDIQVRKFLEGIMEFLETNHVPVLPVE